MEMWEKVLAIIAAIVGVFILISIGKDFLTNIFPEKTNIEGSKLYVVNSILNLIYDCFEANKGRKRSVICVKATISSTEEIFSSDIVDRIDSSKIDVSNVKADDLGKSAEITIRYENEIIYVEKIEYERISS